MSPEQARGKTVDKRTDVWAFGCVLFELLTGTHAFAGGDVSEILAGVIKSEPAWTELPQTIPPTLGVFLRRCLEKDPKRRIKDIGDMRLALEGAFDVPVTTTGVLVDPRRRMGAWRAIAMALAALVAGAAVAGVSAWRWARPGAAAVARFPVISTVRPGTATDSDIAITPDGRHVVYQAGETADAGQLFVRAVDQLDATPVRGLNGPRVPFISPDGNWIGFFETGKLKKVAINGGPAVTICSMSGNPRGASWGPDDSIVFATSEGTTGLLLVSAGGGEPQVVTKPDAAKSEFDHILPEFLPGGRAVLFTIIPRGAPVENSQIAVVDLTSGAQKILVRGGTNPRYAKSGHLVYAVGGTLRAVGFDPGRLEVHGNAVPVVEHVLSKTTGAADFAISDNGSLVYVTGDTLGGAERTLVWVDRMGHEEPVPVPPRAYVYPHVSPDGTRVALDIRDQENDIWIWEFARRTLTRLTFDPGLNRGGVWTPDGKRLAFTVQKDGSESIYWQAADGTGSAERLTQGPMVQFPFAFSPNGLRLLYAQPDTAPFDVGIVDVTGEHKSELLLHASFSETNAEFSPDGRWIAYESNESGQSEIYVRPFPDTNGGRWQISVGGGTRPLWARTGWELFYYAGNKVMAVSVSSGSGFAAGNPQALLQGNYRSPFSGRNYDVSPDGRRFLLIKDANTSKAPATPQELVVVLNWSEELKQRAPAR